MWLHGQGLNIKKPLKITGVGREPPLVLYQCVPLNGSLPTVCSFPCPVQSRPAFHDAMRSNHASRPWGNQCWTGDRHSNHPGDSSRQPASFEPLGCGRRPNQLGPTARAVPLWGVCHVEGALMCPEVSYDASCICLSHSGKPELPTTKATWAAEFTADFPPAVCLELTPALWRVCVCVYACIALLRAI